MALRRDPIARLITPRALRQIVGVLVIVEAVFIAEALPRVLATVLDNEGGLGALLLVLALKSPEIIDFGLPIALVIGTYFSISHVRDQSELIACVAAGVNWRRILGFGGFMGTIAFLVSVLFTGIVEPSASYATRLTLHELRASLIRRHLYDPSTGTRIKEFEGRTIIGTDGGGDGAEVEHLFLYHPSPEGDWHVSSASDWEVVEPGTGTASGAGESRVSKEAGEQYIIKLKNFTDIWIRTQNADAPLVPEISLDGATRAKMPRLSSTSVKTMEFAFDMDDIVQEVDERRNAAEMVIGELRDRFSADRTGDIRRKAGENLARAILCPVAVFLSLAAIALSNYPLGRYLALPLAASLVLVFDVVTRTVIGDASMTGAWAMGQAGLLMLVSLLLPPWLIVRAYGERIVAPHGRGGK